MQTIPSSYSLQKLCGSHRKCLPLWLNEQKDSEVSEDENNCESKE
jgi:hypothetical protein